MSTSTQNPSSIPAPVAGAPETLIRRTDVEKITGLSRAAIYQRVNPNHPCFDASFPKPVRTGGNSVRWVESEVQAWIAARIAARDAKAA